LRAEVDVMTILNTIKVDAIKGNNKNIFNSKQITTRSNREKHIVLNLEMQFRNVIKNFEV
jgi:hypothetical protein